jgi:CRP/FNR family transcriptional regulator, cyclic AMP receptor protein
VTVKGRDLPEMQPHGSLRNAGSTGSSAQQPSKLREHISFVPFLAFLSGAELKELENAVIERKYAKDQVVLSEEDTCRYFYLIYSGKVKVVQVDAAGREHIVAIHKKGDFFGEVGILDGKTSPASVIAMENAHVALITKHHFEAHLLSNQKVLEELLRVFCARLRASWLKIKVLGFNDAERRIRAVLEIIAMQNGVVKPGESAVLPKLTHTDIASYASLSRETVTRQLRKLCRTNEISILDSRQIVLNQDFFKNSEIL